MHSKVEPFKRALGEVGPLSLSLSLSLRRAYQTLRFSLPFGAEEVWGASNPHDMIHGKISKATTLRWIYRLTASSLSP